jgi:sensor histidine kinase YesM
MFSKKNTGTFARNLIFYVAYWIVYLLFFSVQRLFAMKEILEKMAPDEQISVFISSFFTNLIFLPLVIIASHFVVSYLLPKFYFRNRFYLFSLLVGLTILLYPILVYVLRVIIVDKLYPNPEKYSINNYFAAMLIFVFGMAPLAWYEMARHLRAEERIRQKIDKDRLEALLKLKETELKLLKSQIQPHFLFNTLNNLYSLALEKSERTPELIIRLSDMLSYIIYDCKSERVPLSKEIEFIKNYIELQKVRFETCDVSFTSKCELPDRMIAPMILHTFIDNCFKHGAEKDPGNPWIRVRITSKNGTLFLAVINSMCDGASANTANEGIGIDNTRKRLELIYRERHELVLHNSGKKFSVFLKMQL